MTNTKKYRGTIGILTGGGDVPGLNPAIRAVTVRALREGFKVLGIRQGWAGLIEIDRDRKNGSDYVIDLTEEVVNKVGRTGGTFLHSSRTRPSHVPLTAAMATTSTTSLPRCSPTSSIWASTPWCPSAATTPSPTESTFTTRGCR